MTFTMSWGFPPVVALPGQLPAATQIIYYDADVASGGTGTSVDPYGGPLPGTLAGHTYISAGTRIMCKGTLNSTSGNFGVLLKGGTAANPVVYVGNDPGWGNLIIDGSKTLSPVACTSSGDAFGNTNWANLKKAPLAGTVGFTAEDYRHCLYTGAERNYQWLAGYPQLSNVDALDYTQYCPCTTNNDIFYPATPTASPATFAKPRISLVDANVAMGDTAGGFPPGFLQGVLDSNTMPIVQMRIAPNQWYTAVMERVDADLTPNPAGDYLYPIAGSDSLGASATGYALSEYRFRILNVPKAIDRAGQYVIKPSSVNPYVLSDILGWPEAGSPTWRRGQGKSGLSFGNNHIWLHGIHFAGMSNSRTVTYPTGADGGNSIQVENGIDSNTLVIQRCQFLGFGSYGYQSRQQAYDTALHCKRYFNTYKNQVIGSAIEMGSGSGARVQYCDFDYIHGSNIRLVGGALLSETHLNHKNVIIEGNRIRNCNDLHGNGITLYTAKYAPFIVRGNLIQNTGRPLTSEVNTNYDTATYGAAECIIEFNTMVASGYGTSAACRPQNQNELGIIIRNNQLRSGYNSSGTELQAIGCATALSTSLNGPWSNNTTVGATITGTPATFFAAGGGNVNTLHAAGGDAIVATWDALTVPDVAYAPQGVGHAAGGWDGLS